MSASAPRPAPIDVRQLGLWSALLSLGGAFWLLGGMELIERLAYFGVKIVRVIYASSPRSSGGLGVDLTDFGVILSAWAFVQTALPVVSGGISDRIGLKRVLVFATFCKIASYIVMAFFPTYGGFMVGALLLAFGTGLFKPAVQGAMVRVTSRLNSSVAWGVFYQVINIGAFLGPLLAAYLRQIEWRYLFLFCAVSVSLNFVLLAIYREPKSAARAAEVSAAGTRGVLWREMLAELMRPQVLVYLLLFSGFWFMFLAMFDILPIFIHDWIDTRVIVQSLFGSGGTGNPAAIFLFGMANTGLYIKPEGLVNLNSAMIMLMCFAIAGAGARLRAVHSMTLGVLLCSSAMFVFGAGGGAWACVAGVVIFSIGEMLSSPKFLEFLGNLAPRDKTAMYLGFSALPQGIAATLEGYLGPHWYDTWASKETLARQYLLNHGMQPEAVQALPKGEAFEALVRITHQSHDTATALLYAQNDVGAIWYVFGTMGILSAVGLWLYGRWVLHMARTEALK